MKLKPLYLVSAFDLIVIATVSSLPVADRVDIVGTADDVSAEELAEAVADEGGTRSMFTARH